MSMALIAGSRRGPYEIQYRLGAGGMGDVWRARDTKLNRDVALKILPEVFALDPDRLAQFKSEPQLLASLNHPNIGGIYGFEESNSVQALVLELVEDRRSPTASRKVPFRSSTRCRLRARSSSRLRYFTYIKPVENDRGAPGVARGRLEGGALSDAQDILVTDQ